MCACAPQLTGGAGDGGDGGSVDAAADRDAADTGCAPDARACDGATLLVCRDGEWIADRVCERVCSRYLGCVACEPLTGTCSGGVSTMCRADGSGFDDIDCDPLQGMACDADTGLCSGACAPQQLGASYIGCDYYPTVTGNQVDDNFAFAVVVSNTRDEPATVHIQGGALSAPRTFPVPARSVAVEHLPWVAPLKACTSHGQMWCGAPQSSSTRVAGGAYRLRSTQPVTVYQFNPLDYARADQHSYTNDASLLLPANAMTGHYVVATYPAFRVGDTPIAPGLLAVTATDDDTHVTITPRATTDAGDGIGSLPAGVPTTIVLDGGDVVELFADDGDLTGSQVVADRPVQVIGGHYCTQVPVGVIACDHLEEVMFPVDALGARHVVAAAAVPALPSGKRTVVRVVAAADDVALAYDPAQPGAPASLDRAGDVAELDITGALLITASDKVLVSQYMTGKDAGGDTGDPAMALAVPVGQFRRDYRFHAPANYESNYVTVTAAAGTSIWLDGAPLPLSDGVSVGSTSWVVAHRLLDGGEGGDHEITGDAPFGISVYGYGEFTSYWYPGGLDLHPIVID